MRKLDNWLKAYMQYTSPSESPDKIHFWVGISTIAGAIRRKLWVDMGLFDWTSNFYIVLVAPPGIISKTTSMNLGMKLLRKVPGIKFGPDVITWQALTTSLANATEEVPIVVNKADLTKNVFRRMSCLTIAAGEFGTFMNPQDRDMVDVLVSLWDGQLGAFEKMTKTQGTDTIQNPWLNIIACTTPSWIADNFPEYMIGGGFTSRTVWVYADTKRQLVAYPNLQMSEESDTLKENLIYDLTRISELAGEVKLTEGAYQLGREWYEKHYKENSSTLVGDKYAGYMARKQTHVHKLAMILSMAEDDRLWIEEKHLSDAIEIVTSIEADMPMIFESIGSSDLSRKTIQLDKLVRIYGKIERSKLFHMLYRTMSYNDFEEATKACVAANRLTLDTGKDSKLYYTTVDQQ